MNTDKKQRELKHESSRLFGSASAFIGVYRRFNIERV
jgi:hypothetical protein